MPPPGRFGRLRAYSRQIGVVLLLVAAATGVWKFAAGSHAPSAAAITGFGGSLSLVDDNGRAVSDRSFRGKWVLVYFGYTHCPDACPTALNTIAEALDQLGPRRASVEALFITLDPERDTPAVLKDYTQAFQAGIIGLTGTPEDIAAAAKHFRIGYEKRPSSEGDDYTIDHSSIIFLLNPWGQPVAIFSHEMAPERIARRIGEEMK